MDNIKVIDMVWLGGTLGVIKAKDTITNEIKIYIGEGRGENKEEDIKFILEWGVKYSPEEMQRLAGWISSDKER